VPIVRQILASLGFGFAVSVLIAWGIVATQNPDWSGGWTAYHNPHGGDPVVMLSTRRFGSEWVTGMGRPGTFLGREPENVHHYERPIWWPSEAVSFNWKLDYASAAGWPWKCVRAWQTHAVIVIGDEAEFVYNHHAGISLPTGRFAPDGPRTMMLPYGPIWSGLFLNAALWGSIAWATPRVLQWVREIHRAKRGLCRSCGYPTDKSKPTAPCPECGSVVLSRRV
jgi:hypothetical protein